ncbi:MAG: hypothetical protein H7X94_07735 [Vallitaleaceae bacterium]|nr:hypothetical protein [Vallitaleaceae bacterium]
MDPNGCFLFDVDDLKAYDLLLMPFFLTPEEGAETAIYLAISKEVEGITGKYFYKGKAVLSSNKSYDPALALKVWEEGMRLSKIDKQ